MATCVRLAAPVLVRMLRTWLAAVFSVILSLEAMSRLLLPRVSSRSTCISRGVRPAGASGRLSRMRSSRTCLLPAASRRASWRSSSDRASAASPRDRR